MKVETWKFLSFFIIFKRRRKEQNSFLYVKYLVLIWHVVTLNRDIIFVYL